MVVDWGNVKILKDTIRERIHLYTLNGLTKLPEDREPYSKLILVIEGKIEVSCKIGPAKNKTILSDGQSLKIPAGCWYEILSNNDSLSRFLIIEQDLKFNP